MNPNLTAVSSGFLSNKTLKLSGSVQQIGQRAFGGAFIRKIQFGSSDNAFTYARNIDSWPETPFLSAGILSPTFLYTVDALPEIEFYHDGSISQDQYDDFTSTLLYKLFGDFNLPYPTITYYPVS